MNSVKGPNTDTVAEGSRKPSRRWFLRQGVVGAWLFGLGSAAGILSTRAPTASGQAVRTGRTLGKEFAYGLEKTQPTDPTLIQYQETATIQTGLKEVRAVASSALGQIYAAGDRSVVVFDSAQTRLKTIALSDAPRCLAAGEKEALFIGLKDHVEVYSPEGVRTGQWLSAGPNAVLTCIAVAGPDVFVADAGGRIVLHYDLAGKLLGRIGKKEPARNIPGFIIPSPYFDLAVGPGPLLWVANPGRHRIEAYTFDGGFESAWGEASFALSGFCGCCNPAHFALLPDGRFVTSEKGLTRIKVYSPKGEFESVVAGPEHFAKLQHNPDANPLGLDVAVDGAGRVLVADPLGGAVRIFSRLKKKEPGA
jgi:hypothetical protein